MVHVMSRLHTVCCIVVGGVAEGLCVSVCVCCNFFVCVVDAMCYMCLFVHVSCVSLHCCVEVPSECMSLW